MEGFPPLFSCREIRPSFEKKNEKSMIIQNKMYAHFFQPTACNSSSFPFLLNKLWIFHRCGIMHLWEYIKYKYFSLNFQENPLLYYISLFEKGCVFPKLRLRNNSETSFLKTGTDPGCGTHHDLAHWTDFKVIQCAGGSSVKDFHLESKVSPGNSRDEGDGGVGGCS